MNLKAPGAAGIQKIAGLIVQNVDFCVKPPGSLCLLALQLAWVYKCVFVASDRSEIRLVQELAVCDSALKSNLKKKILLARRWFGNELNEMMR